MGSVAPRQRGVRSPYVGKEPVDEELGQLEGREEAQSPAEEEGAGGQGASLRDEYANLALLLVLYTLQGVPMGFSAVLPLILKDRGASFSDLATFSLNSYPFSMKLLWAPVVDVVYIRGLGRRKTWLVPTQLLIGLVLIGLSAALGDLLFVAEPQIKTLTAICFLLFFLCATQDIAVDGWALTMLHRDHVGYAATCNSVGQTFGYALGFTGFMVLEHFKVMSLSRCMMLWGLAFIAITLTVAAVKPEQPVPPEEQPLGLGAAYRQLLDLAKLRAVRWLCLVLLTWKIGFAVVDGAAMFKLQEYGVPKEHMAYLTSIMMPVYILLPAVVAGWTSSATPLDLALSAYPWRVLLVPLTAALAYFTPVKMDPIPWGFYGAILVVSLVGAIASQCMSVSQMAFFARVSDPAMGGTYMTLLNTLANLGGTWPVTATMKFIDITTCSEAACAVKRDGFYVMAVFGFSAGIVWYLIGAAPTRRLQHLKAAEWSVRRAGGRG